MLRPGQVRAGRLLPSQLGLDGVGGGVGGTGPAPGPGGVVVVVPGAVAAHLLLVEALGLPELCSSVLEPDLAERIVFICDSDHQFLFLMFRGEH